MKVLLNNLSKYWTQNMQIIRRYVSEINHFTSREESCELLIKLFMDNLSSIIDESESRFIFTYFISVILTFYAHINFKNDDLIESFIRIFVSEQDGIRDIWSIFIYEDNRILLKDVLKSN